MTSITINLPEPQLLQVEQAAIGLNRPTSDLLTDMVLSAIPSVDDVPAEMKFEARTVVYLDEILSQ